ncbi:hypothetical protein GCM10017771_87710 [Streptomyces capitiformicae]|uniref:Uncharacterized protein n=1 Tax=Streptomyces capitiformicae TaxID=2014920 RepID=A0A918ZPP9_9ACTN|nr:hypothetical protein GCM10017771_87710 [Streptomyces capitiformicae]
MGAVDENDSQADASVELVEEDLDDVAGGWGPPPIRFNPGSEGSGSGQPSSGGGSAPMVSGWR